MYDFHSFSPLPGERFPAQRPGRPGMMAFPVPKQMRDQSGQVFLYTGEFGRLCKPDEIQVFPGHIYRKEAIQGESRHAAH